MGRFLSSSTGNALHDPTVVLHARAAGTKESFAMFRTASRGTHRAPGRAVVDYRGLVAPVGRSVGGVAIGAVTAGVAVSGMGAAHAQAPSAATRVPTTTTSSIPAIRTSSMAPASASSITLRSGARGAAVRSLQEALNARGASLRVDGIFGPGTLSAVRSFQGSAGLTQDGIVGRRTWSALGSAAPSAPVIAAAPSRGMAVPASGTPTLRQGARGDIVAGLQDALRSRGASISADGVFGSRTTAAVRSFQRSVGLKADGIVGARTWAALRGAGSTPAPAAAPAPAQRPERTAAPSRSQESSSASSSSGSIDGSLAVALAAAQLGKPYVWGSSNVNRGFDCSGLTQHVYRSMGISLPRTAKAQALGGRIIPQSEARAGDLVAFTDGDYGHIGLYTGNGRLIDASGSKKGVVERKIWNAPHVFVTYR